jgi:ferredoxin-like protein FixX
MGFRINTDMTTKRRVGVEVCCRRWCARGCEDWYGEDGPQAIRRITNSGCAACGTCDIVYPAPTPIVAQLFPRHRGPAS